MPAYSAKSGVVVGGGLLGLEAAKALQDLGLETHVVEFAPQLMPAQLDEAGGRVLRTRIVELGVGIHTGKQTASITDGGRSVHRICFADGSELETDLIVFSAGIRPRDELARAAGLDVGKRGGVVIDGGCRTSDPNIYAIGECALFEEKLFGLVGAGVSNGGHSRGAGARHARRRFNGADMSTKLKLLGVDVASIGDAHAATRRGEMLFLHG